MKVDYISIAYGIEPYICALFVTAIFLPFYIKALKFFQVGQFIREEGPSSHVVKAKTPTTGGVAFIIGTLVTATLFETAIGIWEPQTVLILAVLCGILGASDDFAKITNKANQGLSPKMRLISEVILGAIFGLVLSKLNPHYSIFVTSKISFALPPIVLICLSAFLVAATTNAINLHDGMDGLAAGTNILVFCCLAIMILCLGPHSYLYPNLSLLAISCAGSLTGFLLFNRYPAKIFMGDTGSLFLGGLIAGLVIASGLVIWFVPLSLIYIAETLSVIAQVVYFKLTKSHPGNAWYKLTHKLPGEGKRLLRMAPLHHHFEAVFADKGIPEWQVVLGFWFVQLCICAAVLVVFFSF